MKCWTLWYHHHHLVDSPVLALYDPVGVGVPWNFDVIWSTMKCSGYSRWATSPEPTASSPKWLSTLYFRQKRTPKHDDWVTRLLYFLFWSRPIFFTLDIMTSGWRGKWGFRFIHHNKVMPETRAISFSHPLPSLRTPDMTEASSAFFKISLFRLFLIVLHKVQLIRPCCLAFFLN